MKYHDIVDLLRHRGLIYTKYDETFVSENFGVDDLIDVIRFAVDKEREACAQLCDKSSQKAPGDMYTDAQWSALKLSIDIRERQIK